MNYLGCSSVLDCNLEDSQSTAKQSIRNSKLASTSMSRFSGPEEQWQEQEKSLYWTNPQLRLSMLNKANVAMFPYSESQPVPSSEPPQNEEPGGNLMRDHGGSLQSNLSKYGCFRDWGGGGAIIIFKKNLKSF